MCQHEAVFRRSVNDRVLTGVAGGIGERLGIDPVVVRLAFVLLTLAGGVGILCYVAAAVAGTRSPPRSTRSRRMWSGRTGQGSRS